MSTQKNTTDFIANMAWNTFKTQWKAFFLLPLTIMIGASVLNFLSTNLVGREAVIARVSIGVVQWILLSTFTTAASKWCSELYSGKKSIDIQSGLSYGLSRFLPLLLTSIVTIIKLFLWSLLFGVPGAYKLICYSQSFKITQLEGLSGSDANDLSQVLVKEAGFLRTMGNYTTILTLSYILLIPIIVILYVTIFVLLVNSPELVHPDLAKSVLLPFVLMVSIWTSIVSGFFGAFGSYQYLIYRDENKAAFQKALKDL